MSWNLSFISEQEFTEHVRATIQKYGDKLESFDLRRFNRNIVDPVKLIFDKTVYRATWEPSVTRFFASATNLTTMTSAIFISEFFSMYQIAMCRRTVKKVAGM